MGKPTKEYRKKLGMIEAGWCDTLRSKKWHYFDKNNYWALCGKMPDSTLIWRGPETLSLQEVETATSLCPACRIAWVERTIYAELMEAKNAARPK